MFKIIFTVDGENYCYGTYGDRNKANEVAISLKPYYDNMVWVEEV